MFYGHLFGGAVGDVLGGLDERSGGLGALQFVIVGRTLGAQHQVGDVGIHIGERSLDLLGRDDAGSGVLTDCLHGAAMHERAGDGGDQKQRVEAPDDVQAEPEGLRLLRSSSAVPGLPWSYCLYRDSGPASERDPIAIVQDGVGHGLDIRRVQSRAVRRTDIAQDERAVIGAGNERVTVGNPIVVIDRYFGQDRALLASPANQADRLVQRDSDRRHVGRRFGTAGIAQGRVDGDLDRPLPRRGRWRRRGFRRRGSFRNGPMRSGGEIVAADLAKVGRGIRARRSAIGTRRRGGWRQRRRNRCGRRALDPGAAFRAEIRLGRIVPFGTNNQVAMALSPVTASG